MILESHESFNSVAELKPNKTKGFELTPEFFYDPCFLLGNKSKDSVVLPKFIQDPFLFIIMQRKMLEADETTSWLPKWIDWVFGCDSRSLDHVFGTTVESTMRNSPRDPQETMHLRLMTEAHPRKLRSEDSEKNFLLARKRKLGVYQPITEDLEIHSEFIHVSVSPDSNEICIITRDSLTILSSKMKSLPKDQSSQGLSVYFESALSSEDMESFCQPVVFDWSRLRVLGVVKNSIGSVGIVDPTDGSFSHHVITTSSITSLKIDQSLAYIGTNEGMLFCLNLGREMPETLFTVLLGSLPQLNKVFDHLTRYRAFLSSQIFPL